MKGKTLNRVHSSPLSVEMSPKGELSQMMMMMFCRRRSRRRHTLALNQKCNVKTLLLFFSLSRLFFLFSASLSLARSPARSLTPSVAVWLYISFFFFSSSIFFITTADCRSTNYRCSSKSFVRSSFSSSSRPHPPYVKRKKQLLVAFNDWSKFDSFID